MASISFKRSLILSVFFCGLLQAQDFTWKKGHTQTAQKGYYGTQGVAGPLNIPGARAGAANWQDASGRFWLYGGEGRDYVGNTGLLSDLWMYDLSTNNWTWVKGTDFIAQLGIYGSKGLAASANRPGGRIGAVSWVDGNGKFWIFGGYGYDSQASMGYLSDLWKFDPLTNNWTWVAGPDTCNQTGTYGTLGTPSPSNNPGARISPVAWKSNNGNLYLFGGMGYNNQATVGSLNDLWMYNIVSGEWTWINGSTSHDQSGTYGSPGVPSSSNTPGARKSAVAWKDNSGDFWMLGGFGKDAASSTSGYMNDLWKYTESTNQWTWIRGSNTAGTQGNYGNLGVPLSSNDPGARAEGATWVDSKNTLWLFGGEGFASVGSGKLNDLWMYDIGTNMWTWIRSSSVADQTGIYGSMGVAAYSNRPGGRNLSTSWIDQKGNLYFFGGEGYGTNSLQKGPLNDLWKYTNCFISPISMTITAQDSVLCAGESTSLTVTGSTNYLWLNTLTNASYLVITPSVSTTYTVLTSNDNSCLYSTMFTHTVSACEGIFDIDQKAAPFVYPNPNSGQFTIQSEQDMRADLIVMNGLGQVVFDRTLAKGTNEISANLPPGVYIYTITRDRVKPTSGKLVIQ